LEFERAAELRDQIHELESQELSVRAATVETSAET
jgi:protein-arginine kinase activator protein McsA